MKISPSLALTSKYFNGPKKVLVYHLSLALALKQAGLSLQREMEIKNEVFTITLSLG